MDNHSADTGKTRAWWIGKAKFWAGPKPWKKPTTNQHVLYRGAWIFFVSSPRWCSRTHIFVDFSGKSRKKHTNSMDQFGVLGKSNSLQGADFQTLFTGLPKSEKDDLSSGVLHSFFGGYIKIPWETCQTTFSNPKKVRWGEERQQYPVDGFFECKIFLSLRCW